MSKVKRQIIDSENYTNMAVPFESAAAANEALTKFYDEVREVRKKYKIPDVLIVTKGSTKYESGETGEFMQHSSFGSTLNQLPMAAYVFGQTQAEHKEIIAKLIAGNV